MAGKRVYISFAAEDAAQCNLLTAALDAWEVTYTTARPALPQSGQLPDVEQAAIRDCAVFMRLCTDATKRSEAMHQDLLFFDTLQAEDRRKHQREQRALVNLILDSGYQREPFDNVTLFIDTANKTRAFWLDELARPLGVATQARRLSRRSALALGVAGAVTLASGGAAATLFVRNKAAADAARNQPPLGAGDTLGGQAAWTLSVSNNAHDPADPTYSNLTGVVMANNLLYAFAQDTFLALPAQAGLSNASPIPLWRDTTYNEIDVLSISLFNSIYPVFVNKDVIVMQVVNAHKLYITVLDVHSRSLLWSTRADSTGPITVAATTIYCIAIINDNFAVYAFDLHAGKILWSTPIGTGTPHPGITYSGGRLYVGQTTSFVCLRADNGEQVWKYDIPGNVTATAIVDKNVVYFGALDGYFYALDAQTGKLHWRTNLNAQVTAPALVANGFVYIGDANGYLWALDAFTGLPAWSNSVFAGFDEKKDAGAPAALIVYPPIIYRNIVAVAAGDTLSAIDLRDGARRWPYKVQQTDTSNRGIATCPVVFGNYFVIGDSNNHVIALNP